MNQAHPTTCPGLPPATSCVPAIPSGIQALIFDFDGTLADTTPVHEQALRAALQPYGFDLDPDWYRQHLGLSIHDLLTMLPGGQRLPHEEITRQSRAHLLATVHSITPIACVLALLRSGRRAGLPCAVASGATRFLVDPGIDALSLRREFAAIVVREDVARGKPAPDLFLAAARRLGVPPGRCLAVDDAPDGVTSAYAAGMRVMTVVDGHLASTREGARAPHPGASSTGPTAARTTADSPCVAVPITWPPRSRDSAR